MKVGRKQTTCHHMQIQSSTQFGSFQFGTHLIGNLLFPFPVHGLFLYSYFLLSSFLFRCGRRCSQIWLVSLLDQKTVLLHFVSFALLDRFLLAHSHSFFLLPAHSIHSLFICMATFSLTNRLALFQSCFGFDFELHSHSQHTYKNASERDNPGVVCWMYL